MAMLSSTRIHAAFLSLKGAMKEVDNANEFHHRISLLLDLL